MHRRAPVAEHSPVPARQDGGHPPALMREVLVTDRIHAAVDPMKPSGLHAAANCLVCQARADELTNPDDAVLARGK